MNFARYISYDSIHLDLYPYWEEVEVEEEKKLNNGQVKETVMRKMAEILYASGKIQNEKRLGTDLFNLHKRTSCAIGCGVAIPHMRCLQTRTIVMGFARYIPGFHFNAPDAEEVQIFLPMIAPSYDDRQYLRIYKVIAKAFLETDIKEELLTAGHPGEIIRILNQYFR